MGGSEKKAARILLVEDNTADVLLFEEYLKGHLPGYQFVWEVTSCISLQSAMRLLDVESFDVVVLDLGLPDSQGVDTFVNFFERHRRVPVVVISGNSDDELALKLLKSGAQDFLSKAGLSSDLLGRTLIYAIERNRFTWQLADLQRQMDADRRQLSEIQQRLIHADKMESLGRMAAGVAHEVKNPLAALQMGVDFIATRTDVADETVHMVVQDMRDSINRANEIMRDMVQYSRSRELERTDGHIHDTLEKALELMRHDLRRKEIVIVKELGDTVPPISFDQSKILQVAINLMTNAVYVTEEGGRLTVRTRRASADELTGTVFHESPAAGGYVVTEISDDGAGIPPEKLGKLFEPFFTTKPPGEGTGLGLSVCKTIVEMHQGDLQLENNPDRGATARIILPV